MEGRTKKEVRWRISFWKVAGLRNKDKGFWNLKLWEVIIMSKTWVEKSA